MKHLFLTIILFFLVSVVTAQETVNVIFTASTESGMYCPFNSVSVTNVTRGWTENLDYPDTVLVLTNTVNVAEYMGKAFCLGNAYPNPFTGETHVLLELPEKSDVLLQVIRIDGSEVVSQSHCFDAGTYRLRVSLSAPQLAFLSVTTRYGRQVTKLLHTGNGTTDALGVDFVSTVTKSPGTDPTRLDATGEFEPGDVMRYEACLLDGGTTVNSTAVTQPLDGDELITLRFALDKPTVTTNEAANITHISAICGGNVTDAGGLMVTARGVCWSTMPNPTMSDDYTTDGMGIGDFDSYLLDLAVETHYYVRAYAINRLGTSYGNEVDFTTLPTPNYTVVVSANPTNGGTVSGGGTYQDGDTCTVHAYANAGFEFTNWIEKGSVVSTEADYTFVVNGNHDMVANFTQQTYTISVSANPSNGGTVSGGGTYTYGQWCTVHANANDGYDFTNWTENGNVVSTNANYNFQVTNSRVLVAHFAETSQIPEGAINGLFTINANGDQVYFSQGNLQYNAAQGTHQCTDGTTKQGTWRFAENQLSFVGGVDYWTGDEWGNVYENGIKCDNTLASSTYNGWIDLFSWGTSGYHDNNDPYNIHFEPWETTDFTVSPEYNFVGYGPSLNMPSPDLTGSSVNYDWGTYNAISNGGNETNLWRTLSMNEWDYVLNSRNTTSGVRYVKATVAGYEGIVLLPDDWDNLYYDLNNINSGTSSFGSNEILLTTWENVFEQAGAVFLLEAGVRGYNIDMGGVLYQRSETAQSAAPLSYWTTTHYDSLTARCLYVFDNSFLFGICLRTDGRSVRLVQEVNPVAR